MNNRLFAPKKLIVTKHAKEQYLARKPNKRLKGANLDNKIRNEIIKDFTVSRYGERINSVEEKGKFYYFPLNSSLQYICKEKDKTIEVITVIQRSRKDKEMLVAMKEYSALSNDLNLILKEIKELDKRTGENSKSACLDVIEDIFS